MINLLIELYDYPYIENFYYIQNNEIKEFSEEIVKKLREISIDALIYYSFMDEHIVKGKLELYRIIDDELREDGRELIFMMVRRD